MNNPFYQVLGNNLVANVTNYTVWFALTFWVFIETQSVFATGMIAGIYLVFLQGPVNLAILRGGRRWTTWSRARRDKKSSQNR